MQEIHYRAGNSRAIDTNQFVILSGCSGGGKSSLLGEMSSRGYPTHSEPGRQIVKEQLHVGGDALPWIDALKFAELCISREMFLYNISQPNGRPTIFDRSIIDNALGLRRAGFEMPEYVTAAIARYRYAARVFLVPPWRELFRGDSERRHSFEEAIEEYEDLLRGYDSYGYRTLVVPKGSVSERADFLERELMTT